jgi:hypothetical protein
MKLHDLGRAAAVASAAIACLLVFGCVRAPTLTGAWREVGRTATVEFGPDGTFRAVDNEGMAVSGRYFPAGDGKVRFEIRHPDLTTEVVVLDATVTEDALTLTGEGAGPAEHYERIRP